MKLFEGDLDRPGAVAVFVIATILVIVVAIYMWPAEKTITEEIPLGDGPVLSSVPVGAKELSPRDFRSLDKDEFVGILFVGVGETSVYFIQFARVGEQVYFVQAERGIALRSSFSYEIHHAQVDVDGEVKVRLNLKPIEKVDLLLSYFALGFIWMIVSAMCLVVYRGDS